MNHACSRKSLTLDTTPSGSSLYIVEQLSKTVTKPTKETDPTSIVEDSEPERAVGGMEEEDDTLEKEAALASPMKGSESREVGKSLIKAKQEPLEPRALARFPGLSIRLISSHFCNTLGTKRMIIQFAPQRNTFFPSSTPTSKSVMAIHPTLLTSAMPTAVAPADAHITHVQLRDLILCLREPGIVNYIHDQGILEHDLHAPPGTPPRIIAAPEFHPNTLAVLRIPDTNNILYATGGQEADLHFSYHTIYGSTLASSSSAASSSASPSSPPRQKRFHPSSTSKLIWQFSKRLENCSINNSVILTNTLGLAYSNESSVEPRVINDRVKTYEKPKRSRIPKIIRTRNLSQRCSTYVYFITALALPKAEGLPFWLPLNALAASFSTAFSADDAKFAVASQEGVVAVWDVRSAKSMKVFQMNKTTGLGPGSSGTGGLWASGAAAAGRSNSAASGWLFEDVHFHGGGAGTLRPPGWSIKFGGGIGGSGREVLAFTEHSNLLHVVDAKTFETEEIVRVPAAKGPAMTPTPLTPSATGTRPSSTRTASESSLASGSRSRPSGLPSVDYVYSQLPGFARRGTRFAGPLTFSTQKDRALRDTQERRVQRAREIVARRLGRRDNGES
ncbi:hypothetical protein F5887DRAFT_1071391 [Amanita rubescens]|nr:hypothetical protein F5887DRAFT_1071391 [Amanita rubescens]